MNTLSSNFGIAVLSRLILGGIGLFVLGLLTRTLGPVGYGYYSLIFAYLFIFSTLADLGLYTILVREISRPAAREGFIVANIFTLRLVALGALLLFGLGLSWLLPYPAEVRLGLMIAGGAAALSSLVQVLTGIFQKYLQLFYVSTADVLARLLQLALVWFYHARQPGLLTFVWIVAAVELVHFLLVLTFARRLVSVRLGFNFVYWRQTITTALPIAVSLVFVMLYFKLDTVLLSLMKPAYDVGVYSAAYKVLETVIFLPAVYVGLVMPLLSRHAFTDVAAFQRVYRQAFDNLAIFGLPIMLYLMLQASAIVRLIGGSGFGSSAGVLQVLAIGILLIFFGNLGGNALVALNLQRQGLWLYLVGAIANIGANLWLIPRYSYYATAWTTVGTELFITGGLFWLIYKTTGAGLRWAVFGRAALAAGLVAAGLYPLRLNFWLTTAIAPLLYFPLLYLLGGFTRADVGELLTLRAKP